MILLHQEIGHKQDVIAIMAFEKEVSESLSNLMVTEYSDVHVLSVYSDLTKKLQAYKILGKASLEDDAWINSDFRGKVYMDFNPDFEFVPGKFAGQNATLSQLGDIAIAYTEVPGHIHYSKGLLKFHETQKGNAIYVYRVLNTYSIFVFSGRNCVFANSFSCSNELELLYFIVSSIEINGLKQEEMNLFIDYSLLKNEKHVEFLKPYFPNVLPLKLEHQELDTQIPLLPEMLFANYLLSLCV